MYRAYTRISGDSSICFIKNLRILHGTQFCDPTLRAASCYTTQTSDHKNTLHMNSSQPANYLRSCRKRSGLSQIDLAQLLGYPDEGTVSRHERLRCVPPLQIALCYEALYRVPVSELFSTAYEAAEQKVEARLAEMEHGLQQCSAKGRDAAMIARKLTWMQERRQSESMSSFSHASNLK